MSTTTHQMNMIQNISMARWSLHMLIEQEKSERSGRHHARNGMEVNPLQQIVIFHCFEEIDFENSLCADWHAMWIRSQYVTYVKHRASDRSDSPFLGLKIEDNTQKKRKVMQKLAAVMKCWRGLPW